MRYDDTSGNCLVQWSITLLSSHNSNPPSCPASTPYVSHNSVVFRRQLTGQVIIRKKITSLNAVSAPPLPALMSFLVRFESLAAEKWSKLAFASPFLYILSAPLSSEAGHLTTYLRGLGHLIWVGREQILSTTIRGQLHVLELKMFQCCFGQVINNLFDSIFF